MDNIWNKYAKLLVSYCLDVKKGERVLIVSTWLAEPLLQELCKEVLIAGGHPEFSVDFQDSEKIFLDNAVEHQLKYISPFKKKAFEEFEAYLNIISPFNLRAGQHTDPQKRKIRSTAMSAINQIYMKRTGNREMKRNLCLFPTAASAQEAGMSLLEYQNFVFDACYLLEDDPVQKWLEVRNYQQKIVDFLSQKENIKYKGDSIDISFSTKGRKWINSDGRNNMPSGEVFTSPVEESVQGHIKFSYPSIYMGKEVEDVWLEVKNGEIQKWDAKRGKELLDEVFAMEGARMFGEAAIGTNKKIQKMTKNILFDEKIGGTIHMAVGQSYFHTGGKNNSPIHWDLITDMKKGGEIYADDELIYKNGEFIID